MMLSAMIGIPACDSDDSDDVVDMIPTPVAEAHVRIIHAGIDAPKVNVKANDNELVVFEAKRPFVGAFYCLAEQEWIPLAPMPHQSRQIRD